MELILHIGADKAGSTAIQAGLYRNAHKLRKWGVLVPRLGMSERHGHGELWQSLVGGIRPEKRLMDKQCTELDLRSALSMGERDGMKKAVFTWEGLYFFSDDQIRSVADALSGFPVEIIVYLREQVEAIQSGILQNKKSPYHVATDRWIPITKWRHMPFAIPDENRNYWDVLSHWAFYFGWQSITVRAYERNSLFQRDSFADFLSFLNISEGILPSDSVADKNESIDLPSAILLDELFSITGLASSAYYDSVMILQEERSGVPTSRHFFSDHQVQFLRWFYEKSNGRVAKKLLGTDSSLFTRFKSAWSNDLEFSESFRFAARLLRSNCKLQAHFGSGWRDVAAKLEERAMGIISAHLNMTEGAEPKVTHDRSSVEANLKGSGVAVHGAFVSESNSLAWRQRDAGRLVVALYRAILGRDPERMGLAYWAAQIGSGIEPEEVITAFIAAAETEGKTFRR